MYILFVGPGVRAGEAVQAAEVPVSAGEGTPRVAHTPHADTGKTRLNIITNNVLYVFLYVSIVDMQTT